MCPKFESYLKSKGIHHELVVPYSPEQNGVAERMNRTLLQSAQSIMVRAGVPDKFWSEAVKCAAYIRNHTPTSPIKGNNTPLEVWSEKIHISHFKVFGYIPYAHVPDTQRQKLDKKAMKLLFVSYSIQSKCYRLLDEETSRIYVRREIVFNEQDFEHGTERVSRRSPPETVEVQTNSEGILKGEEQAKPLQRTQSERIRRPLVRDVIDKCAEAAVDNIQHHAYSARQIIETQTIQEALVDDCSEEWKQAADTEHASLMQNETRELVELPSERPAIERK